MGIAWILRRDGEMTVAISLGETEYIPQNEELWMDATHEQSKGLMEKITDLAKARYRPFFSDVKENFFGVLAYIFMPHPNFENICSRCKKSFNEWKNSAEYQGPFPETLSLKYWCQPCESKLFSSEFLKWTSGNQFIDNYIHNTQLKAPGYMNYLEWIPYNQLKGIQQIGKGGHGIVEVATWLDGRRWLYDPWSRRYKRIGPHLVALKTLKLNNSKIIQGLLNELEGYYSCANASNNVLHCYGLTQHPTTGYYIMVMEFAETDLRKHLKNYSSRLRFPTRIRYLSSIAKGLVSIHHAGLIHCDLHSGNILLWMEPFAEKITNDQLQKIYNNPCVIADMGLCCSIQENVANNKKEIYGVIPYVAPEVLNGQTFTPASDIYSFGIIMWEIATGQMPFANKTHDYDLIQAICNGKRLEVPDGIPIVYKELLERCWSEDISKRPNAEELQRTFKEWLDTDLKTGEFEKVKVQPTHTTPHPGSVYHSTLLPLVHDNEPGKNDDPELNDIELPKINELN